MQYIWPCFLELTGQKDMIENLWETVMGEMFMGQAKATTISGTAWSLTNLVDDAKRDSDNNVIGGGWQCQRLTIIPHTADCQEWKKDFDGLADCLLFFGWLPSSWLPTTDCGFMMFGWLPSGWLPTTDCGFMMFGRLPEWKRWGWSQQYLSFHRGGLDGRLKFLPGALSVVWRRTNQAFERLLGEGSKGQSNIMH